MDPHLAGINFPIIADTSHTVSEAYEIQLNDGTALRDTFIIDPVGAVRHISINELDVGRNISEGLRILPRIKNRGTLSHWLETRAEHPNKL